MKGYICFHQPSGRRVEVRADSSFAARNEGRGAYESKMVRRLRYCGRRRKRGGRGSFSGVAIGN